MLQAIIAQDHKFSEWDLYRVFQTFDRWDRAARFGHHRGDNQDRAGHVAFGRRVEVLAADRLRERGYVTSLTGHQENHDVWANGARVEVKAAHFDGRRWQWNLRGSQADVYLLACCQAGRVLAWYVVPGGDVGDRRHVAIWAADLGAYGGLWAPYLEAWELADKVIEGTAAPWQLELWS
jgi:hypothetical protein